MSSAVHIGILTSHSNMQFSDEPHTSVLSKNSNSAAVRCLGNRDSDVGLADSAVVVSREQIDEQLFAQCHEGHHIDLKTEKTHEGKFVSLQPSKYSGLDCADAVADPTWNNEDEEVIKQTKRELSAAKSEMWDPLDEIDSALLSALSDSRERKTLLRLERVLVDFMKEPNVIAIEVGGAFNSIVLASGEGVDLSMGLSPQNIQEIQFQQQRGLRQTSFQRLILHRLADRFNIIREVIMSPKDYICSTLNLIRLIKTQESCIPSHLLIDIDASLLINYKNPLARGGGAAAPLLIDNDESLRTSSDELQTSIIPEVTSSSQHSIKAKSKKKMVIIKRNSTGSGSSSNHGSQSSRKREEKTRGALKGKKLVDREKAYEEARARIFGIHEMTLNECNGDEDLCEKTNQLNPQTPEFTPFHSFPLDRCYDSSSSKLSDSLHLEDVANESELKNIEKANTPQKEQCLLVTPESEVAASRQTPSTSAITGSVITKAVYRNRQQEENDPDFKRRNDVRPGFMNMTLCSNGIPYGYAPSPYVNLINMPIAQPSMPSNIAVQGQGPLSHYYGQSVHPQPYLYQNQLISPQSHHYFVNSQEFHTVHPFEEGSFPGLQINNVTVNKNTTVDSSNRIVLETNSKSDDQGAPIQTFGNDNDANLSASMTAESKTCFTECETKSEGENCVASPSLEDFPALR